MRFNAPIRVFALCLCILHLCSLCALAQTLGPASSYDELLTLAGEARDGDVLLVRGELNAVDGAPLVTQGMILIRSADGERAAIHSLRLQDASVDFADIDLLDSLSVEGTSNVYLSSGVTVCGADGQAGLTFTGNGSLLLERGSAVTGGSGSAGVSVSHDGGDFYSDIAGTVRGGDGSVGGAGVEISPLSASGALMISGTISGGNGSDIGGNALNLYGLSGNAFVTVDGSIVGGSGHIGGNGMELISASGNAVVGVDGHIDGGQGEEFGGKALMLMNVEGSASVSLSGQLKGGDAVGQGAQPGTSLLMIGEKTASHTRVVGCQFEDGKQLAAAQASEAPYAPEQYACESEPDVQQDAPAPGMQDEPAHVDGESGNPGAPDAVPAD